MNIRKLLVLLLCMTALLLAGVLVSCGENGNQTDETRDPSLPPVTMDSIWEAVAAVVPNAQNMTDAQATYLSGFFGGAKAEDFASYKIAVQSMSTSIDEIGIFEARDASEVKKIEAMIDGFLDLYNDLWNDDYLESEYPKLKNAERVTRGNFVMYVILDDSTRAAAITAFENATK